VSISKSLKWFEYINNKYSGITLLTSPKPIKSIVGCIFSHYQGTGNDFFVDGILAQDGSILVAQINPVQLRLATVSVHEAGSMTQFINADNKNYAAVPRATEFIDAVIKCQ
jgi:hypothetical protein